MTEQTNGAEDIIICRDVHKWYGSFHALRGITTTIKQREVVVVFGPSGSGKSTFIRTLNRLEEHQRGDIIVDGIELTDDVRNIDAIRQDVGMVFQSFNLFPHLTVMSNITLAPTKVRHIPEAEAQQTALELLERVGIHEQADKYPAQLSGGQQQRVAIARALAMQPNIMLFDEPTSALDPGDDQGSAGRDARTSERRMTMIVVSHEMGFAREVCDRMLMFDKGSIVEDGPPQQIFENPQSDRTKLFLSQIPLAKSLPPQWGKTRRNPFPLDGGRLGWG